MRIEVFKSFEEAAPIWREAEAMGACYGFQLFDWLSAWRQTIGAFHDVQPLIVRVTDRSDITAMLIPLGVRSYLGSTVLGFLGGRSADYQAPILRRDVSLGGAEFAALWHEILKRLPRVDVVSFAKMPPRVGDLDNPFAGSLSAQSNGAGYSVVLAGSFEQFWARRSRKLRSDTRRRQRRLAQTGTVSFRVAETRADAESFTAAMICQKARWYRQAGVTNIFDMPAYRAFYTRMAVNHAGSGLIHVSALLVDDEIVATHWGMRHRDRFYHLMPSYEGGPWAQYSTGRLLLYHLVEWCFAHGVKVFDFTVGDEAYKTEWAEGTMELFELQQARTLMGYPVVGASRMVSGAKAWMRRYPALYHTVRRLRNHTANHAA